MERARKWLRLAVSWLPVWALYTAIVVLQHQPTSPKHSAVLALISLMPALPLGLVVAEVTRRFPWPHRLTLRFIAGHIAGALLYSLGWILGLRILLGLVTRHVEFVGTPPGFAGFLVFGTLLYVMVAGTAYVMQSTERAARAEAEAARTQLQALRAQLHPHFVFNALHTVVHLIPEDPALASRAAEGIADLLRTTIEEDRDIVALREEWRFVSGYVDLERLRFGERLSVIADIPDELADADIPSYALLTLVENAIRHGAAPQEGATTVTVRARRREDRLVLTVEDDGAGADQARLEDGAGSGLPRLRARLQALYGRDAALRVEARRDGVTASLDVPLGQDDG